MDPFAEERLQRIHTQITAALVLKSKLLQKGFCADDRIDLKDLIGPALQRGIIDKRIHGILLVINHEANSAKHRLTLQGRL